MGGTYISTGILLDNGSTFSVRDHDGIGSVDLDQHFGSLAIQSTDPKALRRLAAALIEAADRINEAAKS
jgi:hypothetical protein